LTEEEELYLCGTGADEWPLGAWDWEERKEVKIEKNLRITTKDWL